MSLQITDGVYYTGVQNPNMRVFDVIMRTEYGTSYNSYLVQGSEKLALIEASHLTFFEYFLDNIREVIGDRPIDYLILNHTEPDHSGCVAKLLELYPNLTVVLSQAAGIYIKNITNKPDIRLQIVRDGDSLDLGGKTLRFISAPFLHWPDSMFTWLPEEKVLFSCDFLGCHYCEPQVLDSRIAYENAYTAAFRYYYDCIFGPFKPYVLKGLDKIRDLDIAYVCNSHGPVLTKGGKLEWAREQYREWSTPKVRNHKRIPLFYCTAYGNTAKIGEAIAKGIRRALPDAEVALYNIIEHDMAMLAGLLNECDAFLIGALTINREAVPPIWQLLGSIEAVNFAKRPAALFGSFGWSGEGFPHVAERLASAKAAVYEKQFKINFVPSDEDLANAEVFGVEFAGTL
jgi:flavorubredoxin